MPKLKYMIELETREVDGHFEKVPVGVWVHDPAVPYGLEMFFLPGNPDAEERANDKLNELVERGQGIPPDYLEYYMASTSFYIHSFSEVVDTEEYGSIDDCGKAISEQVKALMQKVDNKGS